jgi:hypothetical protein
MSNKMNSTKTFFLEMPSLRAGITHSSIGISGSAMKYSRHYLIKALRFVEAMRCAG